VYLYSASSEHTSKALRYGTRSQGISQFYLHTLRSSANGMNRTCLLGSLNFSLTLPYVRIILRLVAEQYTVTVVRKSEL